MKKIPVKLGKDTIVEAVFEIRFNSSTESAADILPGLLFQQLRDSFPKLLRLPSADIPLHIRQADQNLHYVPQYKLLGSDYNLSIGERVFSISCPRPYTGWRENFKDFILKIMGDLKGMDVVDNIERFSIKYINLIPISDEHDLSVFELRLVAGDYDLSKNLTHVRTEILEDGFINVVQIASGVSIESDHAEKHSGALLDIDTIKIDTFSDFWSELPELVEQAHTVEKKIFTEILTDETMKSLEPEYKE